jgi:hydroxymethylglutaryl-CoA lyase
VGELPQAVSIREVGPRDGFQNEPEVIPTERKIELIDALARTGLARLEVTSLVRADVIPQLADAADVLAGIDVPAGVSVSVLIPNERGLDAAMELRERADGARAAFDEINVFMSASETHNRKNVNRSIAESLAGLETVLGDRAVDVLAAPASRSPRHCATRGQRRSASATPPAWPTRVRCRSSSPRHRHRWGRGWS